MNNTRLKTWTVSKKYHVIPTTKGHSTKFTTSITVSNTLASYIDHARCEVRYCNIVDIFNCLHLTSKQVLLLSSAVFSFEMCKYFFVG